MPQEFADLPGAVESVLRGFFRSRDGLLAPVGGGVPDTVEALERFVLRGGKRVRPAFAWVGWVGAGGSAQDPAAAAVLRVCAALELIQACALIHDDIIDLSDTRRGHPTVHVEFAARHRERGWSGDPERFGDAMAILLGDVALAWADDMVRESGLPGDAQARLRDPWAAMRTEVLAGQFLDIIVEAAGDEAPESALRVDRFKTAAYTVERPLHLGAALAGADAGLVAAYRRFGTDIGVAFQLRDDLLGVFGDPEVTGKPSGDDLRAGKRTLLLALALRAADGADPAAAAELRAGVGTDLDGDGVRRLRALITGLGATDAVEARIHELTTSGIAALEGSSAAPQAKDQLRAMALAATRRTY